MPDPVVVNSLSQQIRAVQRRWRVLLAVLAGGLLLTLLVALLWPATYRSSATILIEQQEIPQDLVRSTITTFADQRVQVISQRVMTTVNLLDLIHRYNLYPRQQKSEPRETLIERMRDDIRMSMIRAAAARRRRTSLSPCPTRVVPPTWRRKSPTSSPRSTSTKISPAAPASPRIRRAFSLPK